MHAVPLLASLTLPACLPAPPQSMRDLGLESLGAQLSLLGRQVASSLNSILPAGRCLRLRPCPAPPPPYRRRMGLLSPSTRAALHAHRMQLDV